MAGCTRAERCREFGPTTQAIRNGVHQADRDAGPRDDGPTRVEREQIHQLRREVKALHQERDPGNSRGLIRTDVIHPSNQDRRDVARFRTTLQRCRVRPSVGPIGHCSRTAMCESVVAKVGCELFVRSRFQAWAQGGLTLWRLIEGRYNPTLATPLRTKVPPLLRYRLWYREAFTEPKP